MTKNYAKERHIPVTCNVPLFSNEFFDFYWNENKQKPVCITFSKKAKNKFWYNQFLSYESMMKKVEETISNAVSWKQRIEKNKAERNSPHNLKQGDVLVCSWGYDQTNIDFYKVIKLVGKQSVMLQAMFKKYCKTVDGDPHDKVAADTVKENAEPFTVRVNGKDNSVKLSSFEYAKKWDGNPTYQTGYNYGH